MAYCTKCGKQNPDTAKFCTGCGATLTNAIVQPAQQTKIPNASNSLKPESNRKNKTTWVIVGTIVLIGLLAGAYFLFFTKKKGDTGSTTVANSDSLSTDSGTNNDASTPSNDDQGQASFTNIDGKLVYKSDCFVIITGSFSYETDAKTEVRRMINEGYANAGYLWIPDYPSLSGKEFYAPFVGPFKSYGECENNLKSLPKTGRFWYGIKVSFDNTRVEIR